MSILNKISDNKFKYLKIAIIIIVIFVITAINCIDYLFFSKSFTGLVFDISIGTFFSIALILFLFYIINRKNQQQKNQLDQLVDAYKYIGQMNRKIDALLELDISSIDNSKQNSISETSLKIFRQLINLVDADTGLLYLKRPSKIIWFYNKENNKTLGKILANLAKKDIKDFKFNQGKENEKYFRQLGVEHDLLKNINIVTKPVYMHQQNIGIMILLYPKNHILEERDLNIIRIFSFYIALNVTFKPDFSKFNSKFES